MNMSNSLVYWLKTRAWPLWLEYGVDWKRGAFNESLTLEGYRSTAQFRRLRVLARQIYVFSKAHLQGLPKADVAVDLGLNYLFRHAQQPDGGYAWKFDLQGQVVDDRRDLYDHAFVLLALAAAAEVRPGLQLRAQALAVDDFITARLRHPLVGYMESFPPHLPRRQNPHMHLFEASLAAAEIFREEKFLVRARELASLFLNHFLNDLTGCLPEYFNDTLVYESQNGRFIWEPGHHCEWVWLLDWYERLTGDTTIAIARRRLWDAVVRYGVEPVSGVLVDEVWSDGTIRSSSARLWPQTERLKSSLIMSREWKTERSLAEAALWPYLRADGTWFERKGADGIYSSESAPASSLYHLSSGILFESQQ